MAKCVYIISVLNSIILINQMYNISFILINLMLEKNIIHLKIIQLYNYSKMAKCVYITAVLN